MVSNTKVTMAALKGISRTIKECVHIMIVLRILEPLAEGLVNNDRYQDYQTDQILEQFETLQGTLLCERSDDSD
ncbi:hypothetical protein DL769_001039 [Monosporascus sp. CRB-8-3]|nr:hypothetical protein DL769_001039 [Monosporascus sp. CRB-8-3]